jgi:TatD DNase family protein
MYIDSHCHLIHKRLLHIGEPAQIVQNAADAGVTGMLSVCCNITEEMDQLTALANQFDNVWCSVGTHPHDAEKEEEKAITQEKLVELATSNENIVAIGETGLDYYYKNSSVEDQQESFRKHIRACVDTELPMIIHARDADNDLMRIVREEGSGTNLKGVMHCFSSSPALGEDALDFGFYISFSGIVTFKKAQELQEFAKTVPLDRILIETDAPYLAPEPHRGQINEPALVVHTAKYLADLHSISKEKLASITKTNFFNLFDKAHDNNMEAA